jgi:hypothetical protein
MSKFIIKRKTLTIEYEDINGFLEKILFFKNIEDFEKYIINPSKDLIFRVKIY